MQPSEWQAARAGRLLTDHLTTQCDFFETEAYKEWRKGTIRVLTYQGGPRSGKSSFATSIAEQLRAEDQDVLVVSLGHGSVMPCPTLENISYSMLIVDGLDHAANRNEILQMISSLSIPTLLVQSRTHIEDSKCAECNGNLFDPHRFCADCELLTCDGCEQCQHDTELRALQGKLGLQDASYIQQRIDALVNTDAGAVPSPTNRSVPDVVDLIKKRASESFVNARLLTEHWTRFQDPALFDVQDHILKCEIEFYDSLRHNMSEAGLVALALVAADSPFRVDELLDAINVLTDVELMLDELLSETKHLIEIIWDEVPIAVFEYATIRTYLREEADLPVIDMIELCREGLQHDGPFSRWAIRNWSKYGGPDDVSQYLISFEHNRGPTFLALNDDSNASFYGIDVEHLKAWHGFETSSDRPDQRGSMPIHIAAERGHFNHIRAMPTGLDGRGRSAFQIAAEAKHVSVCEALDIDLESAVKHKPAMAKQYIEKHGCNDMRVLHAAIRAGRKNIVKLFERQDHTARVLLVQTMPDLLHDPTGLEAYATAESMHLFHLDTTPDLSSPLHVADLEASHGLLKYAASVNGLGQTALWNAVSEGGERIDLLIQHIDVSQLDNCGQTAFSFAVDDGKYGIALKMLPYAKPSSSELATLLPYAIKEDAPDSVKLLVLKGAHLWSYAKMGMRPSEMAKRRRSSDQMIALLEDLEEKLISGMTLKDACR